MTLVKSTVLSLGLLTAVAFAAQAQSNVAALPPGTAPAAAPAVVAPSPKYVGPNPGSLWGIQEQHTQPVTPSPKYVGPNPGSLWGTQEAHTQPVVPSTRYPGPRTN